MHFRQPLRVCFGSYLPRQAAAALLFTGSLWDGAPNEGHFTDRRVEPADPQVIFAGRHVKPLKPYLKPLGRRVKPLKPVNF